MATPEPTSKPKGTHGGRRPGSGAPKGNVNNLRHGLDSRTLLKAAMIIVTFPDVQRLFEAVINSTDRSRYRSVLTAARANLRGDPTLADSIKSDAALALLQTLDQIQEGLQLREIFQVNRVNQVASTTRKPTRTRPTPDSAIQIKTCSFVHV